MFRKRKPTKLLSADELKSKLYAHFDKTGSLNKMKTEIRGKLVTELFKMRSPLEQSGAPSFGGFEKTLLPLQVCNWLVYDHLLRQGYQYALSTFVAEASVSHPEQLLTAGDILGLFGLDSASREYKSISQMYSVNNEQDLLHSLLLAVVKSLLDFTSKEGNQAKEVRSAGGNNDIDEINALKNSSFEERLLLLKEEKEKEIHALREKWLQELDRLHSQERTMKEDIDLKKREIQRQLDQVFAEKEKLKDKEYFLTKELENNLEKKTRELQTEYLSKIHTVENELKISQGKLYDKDLRIAQVETDYASLQTSYNSLKRESEDIKQTFKGTKDKYSSLLDENTKLLRKFESMSDYSILKGDLEIRSNEVSDLQRQLEDFKVSLKNETDASFERIKTLETKLKQKESLLADSQRQLSTCRETMHREEAIWHRERRKLESDSLEFKEMYKNLVKRNEELRNDIQALHQTVHILHYQFTYSDKKNESKPNSLFRSTGTMPIMNRIEPSIFRINNNFKDTPAYTDDSLKFIEEAKGRIKSLEKEANILRDKCSSVFTSVPSLGSFQDKNNAMTPLIYNVSNIPNVPTKTFQSNLGYNFENLIRNEIPTLDSFLQTHLKTTHNKDQILGKDGQPYSSADIIKNAEMRRDSTPFSGISSPNIHPQNLVSKNSKDIVDSSITKNEKAPQDISSSRQLSDEIRHESVKRKQRLKNKSSVQSQPSNVLHHLQPQFTKEQVSDSMSENLIKPSYMSEIGFDSTPPTYMHSLHQFDSRVPSEKTNKKSSSTNNGDPVLNRELSLKEDSSVNQDNSKLLDSEIPLKDDLESKPNPSADIDSVALSDPTPKPKEVDIDSVLKKQSIPPVIDLDSAWKRKMSVKDSSENQSVPFFSSIDSAWRRKSVVLPSQSKPSSISSSPKKSAERQSESENPDQVTIKKKEMSSSPHDDKALSSDSNNTYNQSIQDVESESKTEASPAHEVQSDVSNINLTEKSIHDESKEPIEEKLTIPDEEPVLEGISSEASDIHLSCGSDREQPKEDSDNW